MNWPRSLLARNAALMVALVLGGQIISIVSHLLLVQLPRAGQLAQLTSQYLSVLEQSLAAAPPADRDRIIRDTGNGMLRIERNPPQSVPSSGWLAQIFVGQVERLLPDRQIFISTESEHLLWLEARVNGERLWIVTEARSMVADNVNTWLVVSLTGVGIGLVGALLINIRINRPLGELAEAARKVGAGIHGPRLPEDGPTELATVATAFNSMVTDLDTLDRDRALMLAGISHDLRTPLTRARIAVEMLGKDADQELIHGIVDNIDRVDRTLGQFLAFARDETIEQASYCNINQLVSGVLEGHWRSGTEIGFEPGELPEILARPLAIGRAIDNLVENALKYGLPPFRLRTLMDGDGATVIISDHGEGIAPVDVERLLQPFQQMRPDQGRSAGLGLAITARIARLHQGKLTFGRGIHGAFEVRLCIMQAET